MYQKAVKVTHGDLNGDLVVESQSPVLIHGIIVTNIDTVDTFEVTFAKGDGTDFMSISVLAGETFIMNVPFLADSGIKAETLGATDGPTCKVTFLHGHPGV